MAVDHLSELRDQVNRIEQSMKNVRLYSFQLISEDGATRVDIDKFQRALVIADEAFGDLKERIK